MSDNMIYDWDKPSEPLERRLEAARLEIDTLWCDLFDIANYNVTTDIEVVKKWARENIEQGHTRSKGLS